MLEVRVGKEYYNQDGIVVRHSTKADVDYLKDHLRQSDIQEIWSSDHITPEEALKQGLEKSIFCCTVLNGSPIAMFGIVPETVLGQKASVWFLASKDLKNIKRRFLRHSKYFINLMLDFYPYLHNYVDNNNKDSIDWLRYCGARIKEPEPYGKEQQPFRYFYFNRRKR